MKRAFLLFTLAALAMMLVPPPCWSAELLPSRVARTLDITSFPNSIRPGLKPGTTTLAQNGFMQAEPVKGNARSVGVHPPDHSWLFEITVLGGEGDDVTVCVLDQALTAARL